MKEKNFSLGSDALKLTISKFITMAITMISAMLLSRFRTLTEYGTYSQMMMVISLANSIFMLGIPNSLNFFLARAEDDTEKQNFLSVYYTLNTVLSILVGIILVLSVPFMVSYFRNEEIRDFIYFLAVYPWTVIIASGIENMLIVYQRTSMLMTYRISHSVMLVIIILLVQIMGWSFREYMLLLVLVQAVYAVAVYIIAERVSGGFGISADSALVKKILLFSIPIGMSAVVGTLNIEIDKLVIGKYMNTEQLAIYTNGAKEMPINVIAQSLTAVLMPQMARMMKADRYDEAVDLWGKTIELSYIIICFLTMGFIVFASDVISIMYSSKYIDSVLVFRIYSLVLLLRCTYFGTILNAMGKTKFIFFSAVVSMLLNLILNILFFNMFGIIGPAISTVLSQAFIVVAQLLVTSKQTGISMRKIFPWRKIAVITAANVILGGGLLLAKHILSAEKVIGSEMESIILGAIGGIIYIIFVKKEGIGIWKSLKKN